MSGNNPDVGIKGVTAGRDVQIYVGFHSTNWYVLFLVSVCAVAIAIAIYKSSAPKAIQAEPKAVLAHTQTGSELFKMVVQGNGVGGLAGAGEIKLFEAMIWGAEFASASDMKLFLSKIDEESRSLSPAVIGCALWLSETSGFGELTPILQGDLSRGRPDPKVTSFHLRDDDDWFVHNGNRITTGRYVDMEYFKIGTADRSPVEVLAGVSWWDAFALAKWMGGRLPTEEEMSAYAKHFANEKSDQLWWISPRPQTTQRWGWFPVMTVSGSLCTKGDMFGSNALMSMRVAIVIPLSKN